MEKHGIFSGYFRGATLGTTVLLASQIPSVAGCQQCPDVGCGWPLNVTISNELLEKGDVVITADGREMDCESHEECTTNTFDEDAVTYVMSHRPELLEVEIVGDAGEVVESFELTPTYDTDSHPFCRESCLNQAWIELP